MISIGREASPSAGGGIRLFTTIWFRLCEWSKVKDQLGIEDVQVDGHWPVFEKSIAVATLLTKLLVWVLINSVSACVSVLKVVHQVCG